jgi:hypothetical protein
MAKKICDLLLLIAAGILLLFGLGAALFFPKDVNAYENRTAYQFPAFTKTGFLDTSFQDGVEDTLMDQVPFSENAKQSYNFLNSHLVWNLVHPVFQQNPDHYFNFLGVEIFGGDTYTYPVRNMEEMQPKLDAKIENLNSCIEAHPDLEFYAYFIEKDTEINFETGEQIPAAEYIFEGLDLPAENTFCYETNSFQDFSDHFYKTDHHWNYEGSYLGYQTAAALLQVPAEDLLSPLEEITLPYRFLGSKASTAGTDVLSDTFTAFRFEYPAMTITVEGTQVEDYGQQETYFAGTPETISYASFYGDDLGEIIFHQEDFQGENLLVIGESYDNAILKLLASHFANTYSIDLRHYQRTMGKPFSFSQYVEEHNIQKVLLIGNIDYYLMEEFMLEE